MGIEKLRFEEVQEMLWALNYTMVMDLGRGKYRAINPFKEERVFGSIMADNEQDILVISERSLKGVMQEQKDFQTFEVDFISDDEEYHIFIHDYTIGAEQPLQVFMDGVVDDIKKVEQKDVFY